MNGRLVAIIGRLRRWTAAGAVAALAGCAGVASDAASVAPPAGPETTTAATTDEVAVVPLRGVGDHLAVPVRINGGAARWFMLDTGAAVDAVTRGSGRRLGLERMGEIDVTGIAGTERVGVYRADTLSVGDVPLGVGSVAELDLAAFNRASGAGVGGVLGFRGFADRAFSLDQAAMTLTLHPPGRRPEATGQPQALASFHGLPSIVVELGGGRRVRLIIDTGMDNELMLPIEVLQRWPDIAAAPVAGRGAATGVGGTISSFAGWVKRLELFGVTLRNVPVTFEDPPAGMAVEPPVGRIGNRLLRHFRLTFDPPRRRVYGEWRPLDP